VSEAVTILDEPKLVFRYGQRASDPHDGLALFGAYDADHPSHPRSVSYALIGTRSGADAFLAWSAQMAGPLPGKDDSLRLWPHFPGFEAAFGAAWPNAPTRAHVLDDAGLLADVRDADASKRAAAVVDRYLDALAKFRDRDEHLHVAVCVVPDVVWTNCRPKSFVAEAIGQRISSGEKKLRRAGQGGLFERYDPEIYSYSVDFRRQLKARSMKYGIPIQIVRESTLRLDDVNALGIRGLTRRSDRAWNLGTALYYKACGRPWKVADAREGVCYVGIAYKQSDADPRSRSACCAAQMFIDSGDGLVFMGKFGPWYSPKDNAFHLDREAARDLLKGALDSYAKNDGRPLREIFLHCRSGLDRDEWRGFEEACPDGVRLVGVRVRRDNGLRLMREGTRPILRGTTWKVSDRRAFLWGSGFKPSLRSYDGWEVPKPVQIEVQFGTADIDQVARDIYGLTKLNYNACKLGESEPVTVGFSDMVGEILVSNPTVTDRRPQFRFYI